MCKNIKIYQKENPEENKVLRAISPAVAGSDIMSDQVQKVANDMLYFLEVQPDGAALAAPQIGINTRMFIISPHIFEAVDRKISDAADLVFINPKIIKQSKKTAFLDEGCFSVRWWYGQVKRSKNITIEAYNKNGVKKTWGAGGLLAQVFQHEIDHLNGVLFCDKAINLEKMAEEKIAEIDAERKQMEKERKKL